MKDILSFMAALALLLPTVVGAVEPISVRDPQAGAENGPVEALNGAKPAVSDKTPVAESVELTPAGKALLKRAKSIMIPELMFREAPVQDAVAFFRRSAQQSDPDKKGLNILVMLPPGSAMAQPKLTIELRNVSVYDALRYSCEATGFQMRIDDNAIVLLPANTTSLD